MGRKRTMLSYYHFCISSQAFVECLTPSKDLVLVYKGKNLAKAFLLRDADSKRRMKETGRLVSMASFRHKEGLLSPTM